MSEIKCPYCGSTNTVSKPKPEADKLMWYLLTPIVLFGICGMIYQLVAGTLPGAFYFLVLAVLPGKSLYTKNRVVKEAMAEWKPSDMVCKNCYKSF